MCESSGCVNAVLCGALEDPISFQSLMWPQRFIHIRTRAHTHTHTHTELTENLSNGPITLLRIAGPVHFLPSRTSSAVRQSGSWIQSLLLQRFF